MGLLDYCIHRTVATQEAMRQRIIAGHVPKWISNRPRNRYIGQVVVSMPSWTCRAELRLIYAWAKTMTMFTGTQHHVSHIVPLNHPYVCGLTVPANLTIKPAKRNMAESNHRWPDMWDQQLEMFDEN
jgi:hypothetical protein